MDQLVVTEYRYNCDEARDIARVFGRIKNTGDKRVSAAEVIAILRSRSGAKKGENRVGIASLNGGESRVFSLTVTMHGPATDVDIQIVPPGETPAEPEES